MSELQFAVLDSEIVFSRRNVFMDAEFRFGRSVVLDFDFEVEGGHAFERDGDDFFAVGFAGTVAVCFAWVVEFGGRTRVDGLEDGDGGEAAGVVVVFAVGEFHEVVCVCSGLTGLGPDGGCASEGLEVLLFQGSGFVSLWIAELLFVGQVEGCVA